MSSETIQSPLLTCPGAIQVPPSFQIHAVRFDSTNEKLASAAFTTQHQTILSKPKAPPLGVLENFKGTFFGRGMNIIWRPNSKAPTTTTFPNPVTGPVPPQAPHESVLEFNLTHETLTFSPPLGAIPNRGLQDQNDITLNAISYAQTVNDVTNEDTGKDDGPSTGIHFEPGIWLHVPATTTNPVLKESLVRMASIPHGTTINAQGLAPAGTFDGSPKFDLFPIDITPFVIGKPKPPLTNPFGKTMTVAEMAEPRLPQDLTKFNQSGFITDEIIKNPILVLGNANKGKTIIKTTVFTVSTDPLQDNALNADATATAAEAPSFGGGTANIAFLSAQANGKGQNANAVRMSSTFWVNTVQHKIVVPKHRFGQDGAPLTISAPIPNDGHPVTQFLVDPPIDITTPKTITVCSTEIQYVQTVDLNFAGLTWPHVSLATLVPTAPIEVPASAFE